MPLQIYTQIWFQLHAYLKCCISKLSLLILIFVIITILKVIWRIVTISKVNKETYKLIRILMRFRKSVFTWLLS